jgi:hypothetical protein
MEMSEEFRISDVVFPGKQPPVLFNRRLGGIQHRSACSDKTAHKCVVIVRDILCDMVHFT